MLEVFRLACRDAGLEEGARRQVVSRHDPSIRFTNSTISSLKPLIALDPVPPTFLCQPALRLRNLDHYLDVGDCSPFGCSFHAFGALWPASGLEAACALAHEVLGALLPAERLVLRGAPVDADLLAAGRSTGWRVATAAGPLDPFRHVFGLDGTTGRNVNLALTGVGASGRTVDVGNVIVLEQDGRVRAVELAFGVNMLLLVGRDLDHPVLATPAADVLGPGHDHAPDLMALDALMASAVLCLDGLRPVSRGRNGRYRQLLTVLLERHGGSLDEVARDLVETIRLESLVRTASSPLHPEDAELTAECAASVVPEHLSLVSARVGRPD